MIDALQPVERIPRPEIYSIPWFAGIPFPDTGSGDGGGDSMSSGVPECSGDTIIVIEGNFIPSAETFTNFIAWDDFSEQDVGVTVSNSMPGGVGFLSDWVIRDIEYPGQPGDDLAGYADESPIVSTLNGGGYFGASWVFTDN